MNKMIFGAFAFATSQIIALAPAEALPVSERVYTSNEAYLISSLSYQSSAARAAMARQFDSKFSEQKRLIDSKDVALGKAQGLLKRYKADTAKARSEIANLEKEIASLKSTFLADLAQRDADFARERATLEKDAQNLLRTPAGQQAMAVYLSSEPGAVKAGLLLFDQIAASRSEADKRGIAMLAYDSYLKGELTTQDMLTRLESVAPPASRTHIDWFYLSKLYSGVVQKDNARNAAQKALETAQDDNDRLNAYSRLADVLEEQEDFKGALTQMQIAQKLAYQGLTINPDGFHKRRGYSSILDSLGDAYLKNDDQKSSLFYFVESSKILQKLNEEFPNRLILWEHIVGNRSRIGNIFSDRNDFDEALVHFRYGLFFAKQAATAAPLYTIHKADLAYLHQRIGDILLEKKDLPGALQEYVASHDIRVKLQQLDSAAYDPQSRLANSFLRLGEVKAKQGNFGGALLDYQQGAKIIRKHSQDDPQSRGKLRELAIAVGRVGNAQTGMGNKRAATVSYKEALSIYQKLVRLDPASVEDQEGVGIFRRKLNLE